MIYTLIVRSSHLKNNYNALQFARILLTQAHQINCIYFLFAGAYTANKFISMPSDEPNIAMQWSEFSQQHNLPLKVCDASAARRGINASNLLTGFKLGSIGELVESCDLADRVITL